MGIRLKSEDQILDAATRKRIIEEIEGSENKRRKNEAYKRYMCFKDKTNRYVVELFLEHLEEETVREMLCAIANISITKKVIDKLAKVYNYGVEREVVGDKAATAMIENMNKVLCLNTTLKQTNRFLRLQKNVALYFKPCPTKEDGVDKWRINPEPMNPYLYDVVEGFYDRTEPMVYIMSDFKPLMANSYSLFDPGRRPLINNNTPLVQEGNNKDEIIADTPEDQGQNERKKYIIWSNSYHFTCYSDGEIVPDAENPNNENPFGICPIVNFAIDQDGSFWAQGGGDIVDGGILLNAVLSHTMYLGIVQGYGQFWMTGENLPRKIKLGPLQAILAEYKDEQKEPKMGFMSANPQLSALRELVDMYIALMLTTNNLSTTGVQSQLSGNRNLASGVALVIDKAESLEDVLDQQQVFLDKEPEIFEVISAISATYGDAMVEDQKGLVLPEGFEDKLSIKFNEPQVIVSEAEKLQNLKLRQDLGIDSMLDLIKKEDPSLTDEQAQEKLTNLMGEKLKEVAMRQTMMKEMGIVPDPTNPQDQNNGQSGNNSQGNKNENSNNNNNGSGNLSNN